MRRFLNFLTGKSESVEAHVKNIRNRCGELAHCSDEALKSTYKLSKPDF